MTTAILERAEPTLVLMACALLVAVAIGVPSGIVAAAHRGSIWDRAAHDRLAARASASPASG